MATIAKTPLEMIQFLLPTLSEKELDQIKANLQMLPRTVPACERMGHKFKLMGMRKAWFSGRVIHELFCERCGCTQEK